MSTIPDTPIRWGLGAATALALASCATTTAPTPPAVNRLEYGTPATATLEPVSGDMDLTPEGQATVAVPYNSASGDRTLYAEFGGAGPFLYSKFLLVHQNPGTSGSANVYWLDGANGKAAGVFVTRSSPATMPTSGSASFAGIYDGILIRKSGNLFSNQIVGDANLTADFATATINGSITNRSDNTIGDTFSDVTLNNAAISSDGSFAGKTSGGDRIGNTKASGGRYSGFILTTGPDALVGGLRIPHKPAGFGGASYTEYGAFSGN